MKSPQRPVRIAVLFCSLLGLLFFALGLLAGLSVVFSRGHHMIHPHPPAAVMFLSLCFYLGVGSTYFFCAYWINRLRNWAAIVALSISSLFAIVPLIVLAIGIYQISDFQGDRLILILFGVIVLVDLIFLAMLTSLIISLIRCFKAFRMLLTGTGGGFEVLPAKVI